MAYVRPAGRAFFPLDEELGLLPGALTPNLQEEVVRLGVWMPFEKAEEEIWRFRGTKISRPTVERLTEEAGAAYVAWQEAEVERIERELPPAAAGPEKQLMSVDGAMIPLVGGEWAEVKTLVLGEVQAPTLEKGQMVIHSRGHTYFSRLADAESFQRQALVEIQARGVETAGSVAAVTDGAEWIQKFVDHHRYDARRILDFPHAAERLSAIAQGVWGEGSAQAQSWYQEQRRQLKQAGPEPVLVSIRELVAAHPQRPELRTHLNYLEKRREQMAYPQFQAAGWPIGDGVVESANKLVVEARLKGSGMHWARPHVNPMLALRNIVCGDHWDEAWPRIVQTLRTQKRSSPRPLSPPAPPLPPPPTLPQPSPPSSQTHLPPPQPDRTSSPTQPWRPPPDHPWRRMPIGRARFRPSLTSIDAKT